MRRVVTSGRVFSKQDVQKALRMLQEIIKSTRDVPKTGLAIFCGVTESGKVSEVLTPPMPVEHWYYRCSKVFEVDEISHLYQTHEQIGYLAMTGVGAILATVEGTRKSVLRSLKAQLQTDTRRGGQSANRLARIRDEKRQLYYEKIECMVTDLIKCNHLFIGGTGEFADALSARLKRNTTWHGQVHTLKVSKSRLSDALSELIELSQSVISSDSAGEMRQVYDELYDKITLSDICVFGDDIQKYSDAGLVEAVYTYEKEDGCVHVDDPRMKMFGRVGVLYYPVEL